MHVLAVRQSCSEAGATTAVCCDFQGGTCVLVGDDVKKVAEAAEFAKKLIGCKIMQNKPYYRTAGHVQVWQEFPFIAPCYSYKPPCTALHENFAYSPS